MTLAVAQTAEHFGVSQHTVLAWIRAGDLAAINVGRTFGGKPRWRITEQSIAAFELLRSASTAPQPERTPRRKSRAKVVEFYEV
jgi:excisionase family DNA binding protein